MGMNPFTAFKIMRNLGDKSTKKKTDELMKDKVFINKLDMKICRSGYDQAFLSKFICPRVSDFTDKIKEETSISDISCNFMSKLGKEIDNNINMAKSHEKEAKESTRIEKQGKTKTYIILF